MRRIALLLLLTLTGCGKGQIGPAPRQIHIVGSSAAYPFSAAAAERLMRDEPNRIAPLVRAGGTGAGIAAFCGGSGNGHPDIVIATRRATPEEAGLCRQNGVIHIAQVMIGRTAFVLASTAQLPGLTRAQLYRALAGPARRWSDIAPGLPATPIRIHGPAPSPAIADGLYDLLLGPGCLDAKASDCTAPKPRTDGAYIGHGADAGLIAAAAIADPGSIAILPYAQAEAHADRLKTIPLDRISPTAANIAAKRYPATAMLFLLAKRREAATVPGLPRLLSYYARGLSPGGSFAALGLIPPNRPTAAAQRLEMIAQGNARL